MCVTILHNCLSSNNVSWVISDRISLIQIVLWCDQIEGDTKGQNYEIINDSRPQASGLRISYLLSLYTACCDSREGGEGAESDFDLLTDTFLLSVVKIDTSIICVGDIFLGKSFIKLTKKFQN